jgi:hypothetical protein
MQSKLGTDPEVFLVLSDDFPDQSLRAPGQGRKIVGDIVPICDKARDGVAFCHQLLHRFPTFVNSNPRPKVIGMNPVVEACPRGEDFHRYTFPPTTGNPPRSRYV